jgi:hypothetical protein
MKDLFPVIATVVFLSGWAARADFITNGSFEAVQISTEFSTNPADIPGWTHSGDQGDALLWHSGPQCCGGTGMAKAGDGDQFVTMGGGFGPFGSSAWSQNVSGLTIGDTYVVNFMMAAEGETPTQQMSVDFLGGSTGSETFTSLPTNTLFWQNWGSDQYSFVATAASGTLEFSVTNQQFDVGLDGVSLVAANTAVPEPSGLMLVAILLGLGTAVTIRRRLIS